MKKGETMKEEWISAEEFFGDSDKEERAPLVRVSDRKVRNKRRAAFEDAKVKMVMRIEGCGREEALRIVAERSDEL